VVLNFDLAATLLDLAGLSIPSHFYGKSLVPLTAQQHLAWREDWPYEYYGYPGYENVKPCRGVRTERYKDFHCFTEPQEFELYDLQNGPDEMRNLHGNPQYAALTAKLAARLEELRRETNDHYSYDPTVP
jgi:arylsulfatase A-like enzyme